MTARGTYAYCLIAADRPPAVRRRLARLPGMGPVRLLDVGRGLWLAVADAPLSRYGEKAINEKLSNLDWVSRAAVAHESVVESFLEQRAILPMKLFTIFASDDRAAERVRSDRRRMTAVVRRVANRLEWGVRVTLDEPGVRTLEKPLRVRKGSASGTDYLSRKKARRDTAIELAARARKTVIDLYDRLAARSSLAKRRGASELPGQGGPLLLDAAFLVPRSRATGFRSLAAREARRLGRLGYRVTLSGPWPPYTFVTD